MFEIKKIKISDVINMNMYFIINSKNMECVVIDPGLNIDQIKKTALNLNVKPIAIFVTHSHWDHILGLNIWQNIPIYIHEKEMFRFLSFEDILIPKIKSKKLKITYFPTQLNFKIVKGCFGNIKIKGFNFSWMFAPGHSPGQIVFYFETNNEKYLFSGDTIFFQTLGKTNLDYGNEKLNLKSAFKILTTYSNDVKILPGHGKNSTIFHEKKYNKKIKIED